MLRSSFLALALLALTAVPAVAQTLVGNDTAPGDSCTDKPAGATRMVADADQDGGMVTLICNGATWEPEAPLISGSCNDGDGVVFDAASGGFRCETAGSIALTDLTDVVITSPDDGVPLVYESASGNWINKTCDDSPNTAFPDLENQPLSTLVSSSIRLMEGITCGTVQVSISGQGVPEYRICSDDSCSSVTTDWTTATNNISSGEYIQVRLTTSASSDSTYSSDIVMGSVTDVWDVTTIGPKTLFLTSTEYDGNLGGLSGADSICQSHADAAGLSGTFKAWLSDSTTSVASRITQSSQQYVTPNGDVLADDWADLTDGVLYTEPNRDENNNAYGATTDFVWTNTTALGAITSTSTADTCNDWVQNSTSFNGNIGEWHQPESAAWTQSTNRRCDDFNPLYCVEL